MRADLHELSAASLRREHGHEARSYHEEERVRQSDGRGEELDPRNNVLQAKFGIRLDASLQVDQEV